ncbi:MAG TPA: glycosyltransferase, partial [Spirochaeta sp.]|nr:glycosyltransferase [Spirochaeta sp.]
KLLSLPDLTAEVLKQAANAEHTPLEFRIAAKLVDSRRFLLANEKPVNIGVVFAMWGEHNRLRLKSDDNPNGEDSLRVKLEQLDWATRETAVNWTLYAVDDGDPNDSGELVRQIAADHPLGDHVKVLYLSKAVPTDTGPLTELASADDSRKGGAILLGCMQAIEDGVDAVMYTDADNSVHLGQIGLLLRPFLQDGMRVVLGNRKHPEAVLVKVEGRWGIGIKALRHMQRMIGQAIFSRGIRDTQAAFKLYDANILNKIIQNPTVFDFSFDTDFILAAIAMDEPFVKVPFAFIDSAAESASIAQGPMTTWETLLKGLVKAVRKHGVPHNEAMARVLDEEILSSADLDAIINHLPPELESAADGDLGNPAIMSPEAMQVWIHECREAAGLL